MSRIRWKPTPKEHTHLRKVKWQHRRRMQRRGNGDRPADPIVLHREHLPLPSRILGLTQQRLRLGVADTLTQMIVLITTSINHHIRPHHHEPNRTALQLSRNLTHKNQPAAQLASHKNAPTCSSALDVENADVIMDRDPHLPQRCVALSDLGGVSHYAIRSSFRISSLVSIPLRAFPTTATVICRIQYANPFLLESKGQTPALAETTNSNCV